MGEEGVVREMDRDPMVMRLRTRDDSPVAQIGELPKRRTWPMLPPRLRLGA